MLVDMEGSLLEKPLGVWGSHSHQSLMELMLLALHTMAVAVHVHSANAYFFSTTGHYERLAEALQHLGCFPGGPGINLDSNTSCRSFQNFVELTEKSSSSFPIPLQDCVKLIHFLERFGTGTFMSIDLCAHLKDPVDAEECLSPGKGDSQRWTRKASLNALSVMMESGSGR